MTTTLENARSSAQRSVGRLVHRLGFSPHLPSGPEGGGGTNRPSLEFVVIGAQKAGSTFLHHAILHHPELYMPVGEVPVFERPTYSPGALEWLDDLMSRSPANRVRGIKRPDYLGRPESPALLHRHAPGARLIVVLREPVARTVSAYFHYMRRGHLPTLPPDEGIPRILDGSVGDDWPRAWEVLAFSRYGECLERYRARFAPEQLLVLVQDDVIRDAPGALRKIYGHLGVDPRHVPPGLEDRALPTVYSLPRVRFLSWAQCFRPEDEGFAPPPVASLPGRLVYLAAMAVDRAVLGPLLGNPRPDLSTSTREALRAALADDREKVLEYVGPAALPWYA